MKLKKWLKHMNTAAIKCNIWIEYEKTDGTFDEDLIYVGSMYDIPYWLVDYKLSPTDENGEAIQYSYQIRKTMDDEGGTPGYDGFIITLREENYYEI